MGFERACMDRLKHAVGRVVALPQLIAPGTCDRVMVKAAIP